MHNSLRRPIYSENNSLGQSHLRVVDYIGGLYFENQRSEWDAPLREEFNHLCSLEDGWDGYGSSAVSFESASRALDFLNSLRTTMENSEPFIQSLTPVLPMLVPVSGGAVQVEWHLDGFFVELFFDHEENVQGEFYSEDGEHNNTHEFVLTDEKVNISPVVNWFKQIRDIAHDQSATA